MDVGRGRGCSVCAGGFGDRLVAFPRACARRREDRGIGDAFGREPTCTCWRTGAYNVAHFFGWPWGKFRPPENAPRFALAWIVMFVAAAAIVMTGVDPVEVVEYSIIFSVIILPLSYFPILMAARDRDYMFPNHNGRLANILGWFYLVVISIAALFAIPLMIMTHGGKG